MEADFVQNMFLCESEFRCHSFWCNRSKDSIETTWPLKMFSQNHKVVNLSRDQQISFEYHCSAFEKEKKGAVFPFKCQATQAILEDPPDHDFKQS